MLSNQLRNILIIVGFKSIYGIKQLNLIFSLDDKDFVL